MTQIKKEKIIKDFVMLYNVASICVIHHFHLLMSYLVVQYHIDFSSVFLQCDAKQSAKPVDVFCRKSCELVKCQGAYTFAP